MWSRSSCTVGLTRVELLAFALVKMNNLGGYAGWRWYGSQKPPKQSFGFADTIRIFIIEGLATVVAAVAAFFLIVDWPENAKFLNTEEKNLLIHRLETDGNSGTARMDRLDSHALKRIFSDWKIWCG